MQKRGRRKEFITDELPCKVRAKKRLGVNNFEKLEGNGRARSGIGRFTHGSLLFSAQFTLAASTDERLGVDAAGLATHDGGEHRPVAPIVHHGKGEALGTRDILKGVEPDESDMAFRALAGLFEMPYPRGQAFYLGGESIPFRRVLVQKLF